MILSFHFHRFYFGLASKLSVRGKKYAKVEEEKKGTPVKKLAAVLKRYVRKRKRPTESTSEILNEIFVFRL